MPTYEYECSACGLKFERRQAMSEPPIAECPECRGEAHRLISGGTGFIFKNSGSGAPPSNRQGCSLENTGRTCCGRRERCEKPPCG